MLRSISSSKHVKDICEPFCWVALPDSQIKKFGPAVWNKTPKISAGEIMTPTWCLHPAKSAETPTRLGIAPNANGAIHLHSRKGCVGRSHKSHIVHQPWGKCPIRLAPGKHLGCRTTLVGTPQASELGVPMSETQRLGVPGAPISDKTSQ